ncbi:MAG: urease accessory protein UreD [Candidatus Acidiferrales bacterium]
MISARDADAGCENRAAGLQSGGVHAALKLDFALDPFTGRTILNVSQQDPPLKVVRAFALADGSALAHLHNVSGGLLGGDKLALSVRVGAGARVQLTTTGATRVYRPREEASPVAQVSDITVGENALLEYVPDAIVPFAGARYLQRTTVHLAAGAGLFWWEILAPGREARGEIFEYECVEMKTDVLALGRPIAAERVRLEPQRRNLSDLSRMGSARYWVTFYICRAGIGSSTWLAAERRLREVAQSLTASGEIAIGISTLVAHGLVIRCLARRGRGVLPALHELWNAAKLLLYGREAVAPRKVN